MMKKSNGLKTSKLGCLILGICCILPNALAGVNSYTIDNYVISSGGEASSGGTYMVQGTIAQVSTATSSGGVYQLQSGYWHEVVRDEEIFKNSFE